MNNSSYYLSHRRSCLTIFGELTTAELCDDECQAAVPHQFLLPIIVHTIWQVLLLLFVVVGVDAGVLLLLAAVGNSIIIAAGAVVFSKDVVVIMIVGGVSAVVIRYWKQSKLEKTQTNA